MANIIMMCGLPGSGKSTYAKEHRGEHDLYISRDLIRFSMLEEGEEYFGKEKLVFDTFVNTINQALNIDSIKNIWVDATEGYLKDHEDNWYKQPSNVVGVLVNPITGRPAKESDEHKKIMYYVRGTEPTNSDPVFDEIMEDN